MVIQQCMLLLSSSLSANVTFMTESLVTLVSVVAAYSTPVVHYQMKKSLWRVWVCHLSHVNVMHIMTRDKLSHGALQNRNTVVS